MFKLTGVYKPKQVNRDNSKSKSSYKKVLVVDAIIQYIDNDFYATIEDGTNYKLDKQSRSTENHKIIYLNSYMFPNLKAIKIIRDKDNIRGLGKYYIPFKVGLRIRGRIRSNNEFEISHIKH